MEEEIKKIEKLREIMLAFIKSKGLNIKDVELGYMGGYLRALSDLEEEFLNK